MRVTIFSCHHQAPDRALSTPLFQSLVSGSRPAHPAVWTDLDGANIACNNAYAELRHQYYVWKNLLGRYDHVGFEHYRRPFLLACHRADELGRTAPEVAALLRRVQAAPGRWGYQVGDDLLRAYFGYREALDEAALARLRGWIATSDIICTTPFMTGGIDRQYIACCGTRYWGAFVAEAAAHPFFADAPGTLETGFSALPALNMYIMRAELFDAYMRLHFEVMESLERRCGPGEGRWIGFLSERLFAMWLRAMKRHNPDLRVRSWPFLVGASKLPEPGGATAPG